MSDIPEYIGKYKILGLIAQGGMGAVYKAIHPSLKRYVVIKKLTVSAKSSGGARFKKEAEILMRLPSPYIVHVHDYFSEEGSRFIVEELVEGCSLEQILSKQISLPVPVAILFMQDCCYALKFAHSNGVIHRDIKPGNILISKRGEIKIGDFGIARDENETKDNKTMAGLSMGTPAYMSPEQFEDSANVDNRADIYSLGIMLYEMLTGTKPYPGDFSLENLRTIKSGKYIKPRRIEKSIPKKIAYMIQKMIKPNPNKRYQSIDALLKQIKRYLKHYDTHELRVQIAKVVVADKKQYNFPVIEPKDKLRRKITRIVIASLIFFTCLVSCWKEGLIHKTILRHWYSPVNVEMVMPRSLSQNMDLPTRAFFFENDNDKIPEVKGSARNFWIKGTKVSEKIQNSKNKVIAERPAEANKIYTMKPVYLRKGNYRVKVVVGPYVWWKSFTVKGEELNLQCDFLKNEKRKVKIKPSVYDSLTGENITAGSEIQIMYKNNWTTLDNLDLGALSSGTVWKVRISKSGYTQETFSLLIDWFQDELFLSASLTKL